MKVIISKKQKPEPAPIEKMFEDIIDNIPELIEAWAKKNAIDKVLPYHYDVLYINAPIAKGYSLSVELKRTVTGGKATYNDPTAIMNAFKRAHVIIAVDGTMKAYDLHMRYDKDTQGYKPLKMDIQRLRIMDAKHHAMDTLVGMHKEPVSKKMAPEKCNTAYPHIIKFRLSIG